MTDMERRCPFCYSNRVTEIASEYVKRKFTCGKCLNDFDEDYILYAPIRGKRALNNVIDERIDNDDK